MTFDTTILLLERERALEVAVPSVLSRRVMEDASIRHVLNSKSPWNTEGSTSVYNQPSLRDVEHVPFGLDSEDYNIDESRTCVRDREDAVCGDGDRGPIH